MHVILFENGKHVFEIIYQTAPKNLKFLKFLSKKKKNLSKI